MNQKGFKNSVHEDGLLNFVSEIVEGNSRGTQKGDKASITDFNTTRISFSWHKHPWSNRRKGSPETQPSEIDVDESMDSRSSLVFNLLTFWGAAVD